MASPFLNMIGPIIFMRLPFVVFTVEETIEDITQRTHVVKIIKNDDNGELHAIIVSTALFSQVGKILLQFLKEAKRTHQR